MKSISFTVYCKPEPQGSMRAFMPKKSRFPVLTSDNSGLKSFRQEVSRTALMTRGTPDVPFGKHHPVEMKAMFYLRRPPSTPKKRIRHVVKPDLSKLLRATEDALTGIIYFDDAQIVRTRMEKHYGIPERVFVEIKDYEPL